MFYVFKRLLGYRSREREREREVPPGGVRLHFRKYSSTDKRLMFVSFYFYFILMSHIKYIYLTDVIPYL